MRTGVADLPLHTGRAPRWLFARMVRLSRALVDTMLLDHGREELLRRLSDPFWFQALSCTLGFDWHSSGTTTTTCGALKEALDPEIHGMAVAGGKGRRSRAALQEIAALGDMLSLSTRRIEALQYASRMAAKVDSALVQDGYSLYHHAFIFTEDGSWAVVQQGMSESRARRYHWLADALEDFVEAPHAAISGERVEPRVLDMTARESRGARETSLDLVREDPTRLRRLCSRQRSLEDYAAGPRELALPPHHAVLEADISERGMEVLRRAYEFQPASYEELVSLRGVGPKTVRSLALIADLVYGTKASWRDPVKYSFAHGGKDGFPYPVDRQLYDHSISFLKEALERSRLEGAEKHRALARLGALVG